MFDMFSGLLGNPDNGEPVGQHYLIGEQTYFIVAKVTAFVGTFLAVRVENDKDCNVQRKPVELIVHMPTYQKEMAKAELDACAAEQQRFYWTVQDAVGSSVWHLASPLGDLGNRAHRESCATGDRRVMNDQFLENLCLHHRRLVDQYLVEHPDAWPPQKKEP